METHASSEKTFGIVAENIIHGDDNVIIGNHTNPYIHPSTSTLSDGSPLERPNTVVGTQDLVIGDRNHISKGQTSKTLPSRSCPTDTNEKTFDIVAENIIHGDDNVIIGNHTNPYIHLSTSTLSDGSPYERSKRVNAEDIVHGHRNHISKGQSSKALPPRSCPTDTNDERSKRVNAEDIVHGHRNHISKGQSSKALPPRSCPSDTNDERSKRVNAEDIVHGHRNHISKGQSSKALPPRSCPSDTNDERSKRVNAEDIVHGHRNHISKGQSSKALPPRSCPTDTNGTLSQQGNLLKSNNNKDYIRNRNIVVKASKSVGIIRGPNNKTGTGVRVGDSYVMTALHVVDDIMKISQKDDNKEINYNNVVDRSFFIEFGYLRQDKERNRADWFGFSKLVYKNEDLDTAILELHPKKNRSFPPPIGRFEELKKDQPVYLIGHPNREPMMYNEIFYFYDYSEEDVKKSKEWAITTGIPDKNDYKGIDNQKKTLFNCSFQHGASGAIGINVGPDHDEPIGVFMLLKGYPEFYYSKNKSFSDEEKKKFLIVEQGVLLKSIEDDMDVDAEQLSTPTLKNNIFNHRIKGCM